jgi:hypothetical protein
MELYEYLWRNHVRGSAFAKKIGVHYQTVAFLANRKQSPSLLNAVIINEESGGQVSFEEMLDKDDTKALAKHRAVAEATAKAEAECAVSETKKETT